MKWGMYKVTLAERGECVRVHWDAGDAAPYLERAHYEAARFEPPFEELPDSDEYHSKHRWMRDSKLVALEQLGHGRTSAEHSA
jgi:hypothetical protein